MSMYSQLLAAALDTTTPPDDEPSTGAAWARLLRCRSRVGVPDASLVDHLAYDVALVELARLLGVECDASEFDRAEPARARLEGALSAQGVRLDDMECRTRA